MTWKSFCLGALLALVSLPASGQTSAKLPTLAEAVKARPFADYGKWWPIGNTFATFMSDAITPEWKALAGNAGDLSPVRRYAAEYVSTVYHRDGRPTLVDDFVQKRFATPVQSGEFDALSYAFFRSAFELIAADRSRAGTLENERRNFTRRVGKRFYGRVQEHLGLALPVQLDSTSSVDRLKTAINRVIAFLTEQRYFRDRAAFRFDVNVPRKSGRIVQPEAAVLDRLKRDGHIYALFEMSYPVILPSAVYLFQTVGEAQHHSSRTVEELFDRIGYVASETSDFDPSGFPSDLVVELWEIAPRSTPRSR